MTKNQFTDAYKRLPDEKLIDILDNKKDFQPLAIETAINELANRGLSDKQINEIRNSNKEVKSRHAQSEQKRKEQLNTVKNTADKALTILDPLVEKTPDRTLKLICLALGLLAIGKIISNLSMAVVMIQDPDWDFSTAWFLADLLVLPVALIPFWKKKKAGLILLSAWLVYMAGGSLWLIGSIFSRSDDTSVMLDIIPTPDLTTIFLTIVISLSLLGYIWSKNVRLLFNTKSNHE